ncbi:ATP-dependent RNA helicase HrpA [Allofrancisella guangzhouensis]|uniref:ATP-dependent helicase n=1 Tax=Allofrancisella guangzhouensis TaxID=594679 RepID=A0A0A8E6X0_9GAMM|nr:ATP-dependent RNA helicase HrpA [Allofrancisella guangzhouensis]AJC49347.1 ATP-dependent helicase [Allofrancisella guangzhouensis]MBK2027013.1 ATP-dependent RNA helicase HrpA [Allofrancisella guangzhouensis]MBK2043921.1 ATP-dependent RNA helicase HrpA [Allofrancisella guangzhouensis]MBK2044966.1 ATP-dependent RNA helicase HrpA [Allofrancisella guangzhouensis]
MSDSQFYNLINQIPTVLRGKYTVAFRKGKDKQISLLEQLKALVLEVESIKLPKITYPDLPVAEKVADIKKMIQENQVIVVAGETGSGKSTQLPKICLDLGLGKRGLIGHTQPRRLAARSIAARVATEIGDQSKVSYKIRFSDQTDENTLIKVMTDGVLLAEIKNDKYLSQYEVIIIDEAHERSLNIDFLLGCIKKILPFRPDLKVIITSATIDHQKFINYFPKAKDIIISGRTYPVEIRYQGDEAFNELSLQERILYAVEELGQGDILVFLPTERDIHETLAYLNKQQLRFTEILPLFSRLSNKDQNKIFNPDDSTRRIILATNVAETSLTVPRIKYVIDSGLARISRYSYRTKVQRLPIEKISQASANQRAGRCGRLSAGVCIRLYSEDDFLSRKEFTDPEILRTNLASVILQMLSLKLGNIQDFPFIDPPDSRFVKDGFKLLFELQAISEPKFSTPKITADGLKMAIIPLDPKLAKIVIEGHKQNCLKEVISIASFLSVQDPRERPLNFQQKADEIHSVDKDKSSDFIAILNLANRLNLELKGLSNKEKKEYFRKNFISPVRFSEWSDIYRQIVEVVHGFKWKLASTGDLNYESLHKTIASGFLSNIGKIYEGVEYLGTRGLKFFIFPGSSQFKKKPKWIVSSEIVETTKTYARNVASIEPEWLESLASHLVKKHYDEPVWSKKRRSVIVNERATLYGLEIISKRAVQYSRINPEHAREIFIREALVNGDFESKAYFYNKNLELISQVEELENKSRRKDILVDEHEMYQHYDHIIPENVFDGVNFDKWLKDISKEEQQKFVFDLESLMQHDAKDITQQKYPDVLTAGDIHLPLEYHFNPLDERDGATITVPLIFLNDIDPVVLEWGVYGFLYDKIVALLRALPKNIRKNCVPVPTYAQAIFESIDFENDRYRPLKSAIARHITRIVGFVVDESAWGDEELDKYLILNIKVVDEVGKVLAIDKDLDKLKLKFKDFVYKTNKQSDDKVYYDWDFGSITQQQQIKEYGVDVRVYNCLEEFKDGIKLSYKATQQEANLCMKKALIKLVKLRLQSQLEKSIKNNDLASLSMSIKLKDSNDKIITKAIEISFFDNQLPRLATQFTPSYRRETDRQKQNNNDVIPDSDWGSFKCSDKNSSEILKKVQGDEGIGLPYTKDHFVEFYKSGLEDFETNKAQIESLVSEIFKVKNQLDKKLNIKKIPLNFIQLYADIKKELDKLFTDDFLSVPLIYLQRYRYYIQALDSRLEKAKANLQRDRAYQIEVDELENKLAKKITSNPYGASSDDVIKATFLIKELWVSWYLQNIRTLESVSYKKIADFISRL